MSFNSLSLYHRLPVPLRSVAASMRGYQLRHIRYGPETEALVQDALLREHWPTSRWRSWQEEQLARTLHHAATQVPYYREQWATRRRHGDQSSWDEVANWPILEKEAVRAHPEAFLADGYTPRRMVEGHTSGTTGKPLRFWGTIDGIRAWYALVEARCRRWYGVSGHDRWGILGGQLVVPATQHRPPYWVWNAGLRQLYMSTYHLAPEAVPHYLDAIRCYRLRYLLGYTSALHVLASEALRLGCTDWDLEVVITNAEPLFEHQRQSIAAAFGCKVRETYGCSEQVVAASECENGHLHLWPEVGYTETVGLDETGAGALVCTSFLDRGMPFIRYRLGDTGSLVKDEAICSCGRGLPVLASVDGRTDDLLYTADGRRISWLLAPVLKAHPVREAQIIQESLNGIRVRYVPAPNFTSATADSMVARVHDRMGPVTVILEPVESIERDANGKFRAVICNLSASEKDQCGAQSATVPDGL